MLHMIALRLLEGFQIHMRLWFVNGRRAGAKAPVHRQDKSPTEAGRNRHHRNKFAAVIRVGCRGPPWTAMAHRGFNAGNQHHSQWPPWPRHFGRPFGGCILPPLTLPFARYQLKTLMGSWPAASRSTQAFAVVTCPCNWDDDVNQSPFWLAQIE